MFFSPNLAKKVLRAHKLKWKNKKMSSTKRFRLKSSVTCGLGVRHPHNAHLLIVPYFEYNPTTHYLKSNLNIWHLDFLKKVYCEAI